MRITGFTGAVKKDLPMIVLGATDSPNFTRGADLGHIAEEECSDLKNIKKYKYLIAYLCFFGDDGMPMRGENYLEIIPLELDFTTVEDDEHMVEKAGFDFMVNDGFIAKLRLDVYRSTGHGWELGVSWQEAYRSDLTEVGENGLFRMNLIGTDFDDDGNYVSGSVFMLV